MTEREINQIFYLAQEISNNTHELLVLRRAIGLKIENSCSDAELNQLIRQIAQLEKRIEACVRERDFINRYIEEIEDDYLRQIFRLRFIKRLSWRETAQMVGGYNSGNGLREIVLRYLKTHDSPKMSIA